jgi:1-acyl-sn-glycerol-3-phosphate acyltransferase
MITFITGMCIALPLTLLPINVLHRVRIISTRQREFLSLRAGELCSFVLLRLIPFTRVQIINDGGKNDGKLVNEPSIWVCNHSSMIDVFILMATIRRNRPIKVIYWKGLEANPVTRWLFKSCGFIPVQMVGNGSGVKNEYDRSSFKDMLKSAKKAFAEGFDLGVLPEGQLNPTPEKGLLEVYPGAYTLSKMSKMPIRMAALYGTHNLWHPLHGMKPTSRNVKVRIYSQPLTFSSSQQFIKTFENVVGHFGATGNDLPNDELQQLLSLKTQNVESDLS